MFKFFYTFCDKLEDKVRARLSRKPIIYAFFGGVGIVLFWRGVWHSADYLMERYFAFMPMESTMSFPELPWWDGPLSLFIGSVLLLSSGIFVSNFIGNEIIISGLRGEKKIVDKTKDEIEMEMNSLSAIQKELKLISTHLKKSKKKLLKKKKYFFRFLSDKNATAPTRLLMRGLRCDSRMAMSGAGP